MRNKQVIWITKVGIFSTLAIVLYSFGIAEFSIPFLFPDFLKINFGLLPCIIAGFLAGPVGGVVTVLIKTLVKLPLSKTMYVGEISDLVIGIIVVLVCSVIYKVIHSKKGAVIALIAGTATWLIVAVLANYLFVIPLYIKLFYGGDTAPLITMMEVIPGINESNYMVKYLFIACLPFNALLAIVSNGVTLIVYKRISKIFDSIEGIEDEETSIT